MKLLSIVAMIASQVMAVSYIPESVFDMHFSEAPGAIAIEVNPATTNTTNSTPIIANLTFVSRTTGDTSIVDNYTISSGSEDLGVATRTLTAHTGFSGAGGLMLGTPYLECRFEIILDSGAEPPAGMEYLTIGDAKKAPYLLTSIQLDWLNVAPSSSVDEIISNDNGLAWRVFPGVMFFPAETRMDVGGIFETDNLLRHRIYVLPNPKAEIIFYATIPCGSGLISPYDPEIVIQPSTPGSSDNGDDTNGGDDEGDDEEEEEEGDDEEGDDEEPTPMIAGPKVVSPLKVRV
ncbi:hypothetical protein NEHOM01_1810 [Nematocida homosporus]|uniref:uncharacterized protein n=1 Tax=Nematocida homosporus TaxID=1912981 RepID=UPI0022203262|nr:uncharacterized protein NEHOM01_1810 [Nematocida homosporus]KAI5186944.1 hypothetical protein NEHOM01_1810 [Nematocida homosporus]